MDDQFEISFNEERLTFREKLYPVFKLAAFLQGKSTSIIQTVEWRGVREVYVYKRDVFAYDLICLTLMTDDESIELTEQMKGWKYLIDSLPKYLPNCLIFEEWFTQVAFPAFEFNLIKIYPREN